MDRDSIPMELAIVEAAARELEDIKVTILGPPFADPDQEERESGDWPADSAERCTASFTAKARVRVP